MTDIILKQNARVLMPTEYEKLRSAMTTPYYQLICDAMLLSGMRPIEFQRFQPSWYRASRRVIVLPDGACLKDKCEYKNRTISLSLPGCDAFDRYVAATAKYKGKVVPVMELLPKRVSFRDTLIRYAESAGIGSEGINPKMFRKTLVSWLVVCFPEKIAYIQSSMGHNQDTIVKNYLGLGFPKSEISIMREKYLTDWGVSV